MSQIKHKSTLIESLIFKFRLPIIILSLIATVFLAYRASFVQPDTQLDKLVPTSHEYVLTAKKFLTDEVEGGSYLRVAVGDKSGNIFNYEYLTTLRKISDELSLLPGVDTGSLNSLWAPAMLWLAITPDGYSSGPVIDNATFVDSSKELEKVRNNILLAGVVGSYVANDFSASLIDFQVLAINPNTQKPVSLTELSDRLEDIRQRYESQGVTVHIIGDAKKLGDLVNGFEQILMFFIVAMLITTLLLYNYSRCLKSTFIPLLCSIIAVIWQLGLLNLFGYDVGVFSILVPFLVFAIAVSHGVQVINAFVHEVGLGHNKLDAARTSFHYLHRPGFVALISDGIGFAMLLVIDIGAIQDLAMVASIGVALVIVTNLVLLPIMLSYTGVTNSAVSHAQTKRSEKSFLWSFLARFAEAKYAKGAVVAAVLLAIGGSYLSQDLKIGDLDKGAPELRADSRYNQDNNFLTEHFSTSTDLMTVFVGTPQKQCETYRTTELIDRLGSQLSQTPGVQNVSSPATTSKMNRYFSNEGNLKMMALTRNERVLQRTMAMNSWGSAQEFDEICDKKQFELELADHKEETLRRVVNTIEDFAKEHDDEQFWVRLGYGNAAFEAATNQVIERSQYEILAYIYAVVAFMVLVMFRSYKAVVCILLPLALTSLLCQALMALLGIGVKVATLPVIALGVGIGVDYGIYIYSRIQSYLQVGEPLAKAYLSTLYTTGKAVSFTGITLAVGVATWYVSPIKFQADMGILLTFMFLWNMIGALTLLPALAYFFNKDNVAQVAQVEKTEN